MSPITKFSALNNNMLNGFLRCVFLAGFTFISFEANAQGGGFPFGGFFGGGGGTTTTSTPSTDSLDANGNLFISDIPLEAGLTPPPNVLLIADDSGSMDWEVVIAQDPLTKDESLESLEFGEEQLRYPHVFGGPIELGGGRFYDPTNNVFSKSNYIDKVTKRNAFATRDHGVAPLFTEVAHLKEEDYGDKTLYKQTKGIWRVRNHKYNLIFYNPNYTYKPWPGYADSNVRNARENPDDSSIDFDLTVNQTMAWQYLKPDLDVHFGQGNIFMPTYYVTIDSNANGKVDFDECAKMFEIKPGAGYRSCDGKNAVPGSFYSEPKPAGRTDCAGASCTYEEEIQNFANWFTYYRRREYVAKAAYSNVVSEVVPTIDGIKIGFTTLNSKDFDNSAYVGGRPSIAVAKNSPEALQGKIYKMDAAAGGTPLLTALDQAGKYFSCETKNIFSDLGTDISSDCPSDSKEDEKFKSCQQNYTVLMTDGFWLEKSGVWDKRSYDIKSSSLAIRRNNDGDGSSNFDGGGFADSNIGNGRGNDWPTLADVAMYYYENDIHPRISNNVRPTAIDKSRIADPNYWNNRNTMHQHMKTFTIGLGVAGVSTDPSIGDVDANGNWAMPDPTQSVNWPKIGPGRDFDANNGKHIDLRHAAFNGRGMYYQGNNAENLSDNLKNVLKAIAQGAGAAGAVSFNSQQTSVGNVVYTASYDAETNAGDVVALAIDEETGVISGTPIWRASDQWSSKVNRDCTSPSDSRVMLTYKRDGTNSQGAAFNAANTGLLTREVNWFRGQKQDEFGSGCSGSFGYRARTTDTLMGDVVHSRPLFVGAPDGERIGITYPRATASLYETYVEANANRDELVFVGANDGFLHAFDATNGREKFAYMPHRLINGDDGNNSVKDLLDTSYSHKYFVDLSPSAENVFIKTRSDASRKWRTVVMGGSRTGGRGYFAIDATDPASFNSESTGANKILWEFSDLDNANLGKSISPALMAMTNTAHATANNGNHWAAIFSNGYNSKDGRASLFVLDLEGGNDGVWTENTDYKVVHATPPVSTGQKNGLGIPRGIDKDGDGTVDYVYAGDLLGNVYRFDLTSKTGAYTSTKIFEAKNAAGTSQPITAQPSVLPHPTDPNSVMVVVATGSWMTRSDTETTDIQSIYGFVDTPNSTRTSVKNRGDLIVRNLVSKTKNGETVRVIKGNAFDFATDAGWYFDFADRGVGKDPNSRNYDRLPVVSPGERAVRNMVERGGYLFVNTVYPNQAQGCDPEYGGSVMGFNPLTGLVDKPLIDFDNNGDFDVVESFLETDNVAGLVTDVNLSDSAMHGNRLVLQRTSSTGAVAQSSIATNTDPVLRTGRLSWSQLQ